MAEKYVNLVKFGFKRKNAKKPQIFSRKKTQINTKKRNLRFPACPATRRDAILMSGGVLNQRWQQSVDILKGERTLLTRTFLNEKKLSGKMMGRKTLN